MITVVCFYVHLFVLLVVFLASCILVVDGVAYVHMCDVIVEWVMLCCEICVRLSILCLV